MRKLTAFDFISLNGFYKGPNEDISWHRHGEEESAYSVEMMASNNILLFGRVTYEMMASYWPTPMAIEQNPEVADGMCRADKIVFSGTLNQAGWQNTILVKADMLAEVKRMKHTPGKDMTLLGSGNILTQLAEAGLIDEYQLMIDPVVLNEGVPIFSNIKHRLRFKLTGSRIFKSGTVVLSYQPA